MRFSWKSFCDAYRLEYDVGKSDIQIRCPFPDCSSDSGKRHMGLSTKANSTAWHCWKCNKGGQHPDFLIRALLGVSRERAREIMREYQGTTGVDDFDSLLEVNSNPTPKRPPVVSFLETIHALTSRRNGGDAFLDYLAINRGFGQEYVRELTLEYGLQYAVTGMFARRIILPIWSMGKLVSYTGRTLAHSEPRYLTAPGTVIKDYVAGFDSLNKEPQDLLLVAEGPMDFMKLDFFGRCLGVRATCTFGTAYTLRQLNLIAGLLDAKFKRAVVVYDKEAELMGGQLAEELRATTGKQVTAHPIGTMFGRTVKDPGDLSPEQVREFVHHIQEVA